MDEEVARSDVEKLQDLLESTTGKSKKQKGKNRGATYYLQEPGSVSLCHAAISLGA